jgi:hypothetical protein
MVQLRGALLSLALCLAGTAQTDVGERARSVLREADVQMALPGDDGNLHGTTSPSGRRYGARTGPREPHRRQAWPLLPCGLAALGPVALWVGVAVAGALLLAAILRARTAGATPPPREPKVVGRRAAGGVPEPAAALPDHERLAAAGDYHGAVHALLARAFTAWTSRGNVLPPHATARQGLRRVQTGMPAEPLAALVAAVERVHFGGEVADRDGYEHARSWFQHWEAACRPPQ